MMPAAEAARVISRHRGDAIAVASSRPLDVWASASQRRALDLDLTDCPDRVAAVALGLSLAQPRRRILALESDATLRSNVSTLATVGTVAPANLVHFLFRDTGHDSTAGVAIPRLDGLDFNAMAKSAGYVASFTFKDIEEMDLALEDILNAPGPQFVTVNVYYDRGPWLRVATPMDKAFAALKKTLSAVA
jgi:phosphonopyruvate decarboxylase